MKEINLIIRKSK